MPTCRLCLYKGDENQVLSVWNSQVEDLATKILNCVSIKIARDDTLSTSTCLSCIHQVTQWEVFKETCQKSQEILKSKYNSSCDSNSNGNRSDSPRNIKPLLRKHNVKKQYEQNFSKEVNCNNPEDLDHEQDYASGNEITLQDNSYPCDICSEKFDTCFEYLDHQETHDGDFVFNCDKCSEVFNNRKSLVEHDKTHITSCTHCGKMILKTSMKLHLITHTDRHMCDQCKRRFNSKAALAQHVITVHTDIKNHICDSCGKRFSSQTALRVHMKSHSEERLYPCNLCSYAGRTASAIYVHMSTHATDVCVCEVCSKTFKSNRNLNDHLRRVHSKVKKYECSYCEKKFVDKYMLEVHVRCHTGVRPYQCNLCEKAFIRSDGLKEHMITHGQRTMYNCGNCNKKFSSRRGVARHTCSSAL